MDGTSIVAFVGPDEQFHVPIWGSVKAYKDPTHLANISGRTGDSKDFAYQEFCIRVYKNLNADRDDSIAIYSDPDNAEEPVDEEPVPEETEEVVEEMEGDSDAVQKRIEELFNLSDLG